MSRERLFYFFNFIYLFFFPFQSLHQLKCKSVEPVHLSGYIDHLSATMRSFFKIEAPLCLKPVYFQQSWCSLARDDNTLLWITVCLFFCQSNAGNRPVWWKKQYVCQIIFIAYLLGKNRWLARHFGPDLNILAFSGWVAVIYVRGSQTLPCQGPLDNINLWRRDPPLSSNFWNCSRGLHFSMRLVASYQWHSTFLISQCHSQQLSNSD